MLCCERCFKDFYLKRLIREKGKKGNCAICSSKKEFCVVATELSGFLQPLLDLYSPVKEITKKDHPKKGEAKYIWEHLSSDFKLLSDNINQKKLLIGIFKDTFEKKEEKKIFTTKVAIENGSIRDMFADRLRLWQELCEELKYANRFFYNTKKLPIRVQGEIFECLVLEISTEKMYRARIADTKKAMLPKDMGAPPVDKTSNGRANPAGIPYLYLASTVDTAIYEVKPGVRDYVSVGKFALQGKVNCVDLREISPVQLYNIDDFETAFKYIGMLSEIGKRLTTSINQKVSDLEYVPTQYFCEMIKHFGYAGVIYNSSSQLGYNIALFDTRSAYCTKVNSHEIAKIKYN